MNATFCISAMFLIMALSGLGCRSNPEARLLRMGFDQSSQQWHLTVDPGRITELISTADLTNHLTSLHLHHGDIIVLGTTPDRKDLALTWTWNWLSSVCETNGVAVYLYAPRPPSRVFSIPVFHWITPFENPLTSEHASFFANGSFIGTGSEGLQKVLAQLSRDHPREVMLIGALYDMDRSLPADASPFTDSLSALQRLEATGITIIRMDPLPGF